MKENFMYESATFSISAFNLALKFIPFRYGYQLFLDRNRLKGISYERISIEKQTSPPNSENEYTVIFKNQVLRTSQKISRKRVKGGTKAKIRLPQTNEEKALIDFHRDDQYRLNYSGSFFSNDAQGNNKRKDTDQLDIEIIKRLDLNPTGTSNRVIYLRGNIGCGKSTLLSTITSQIGGRIFTEIKGAKKNVLDRDICIVSFEEFRAIPDGITSDEYVKIIYEKISAELREQTDFRGETLKDILTNCGQARRFTLILDGLDFIYIYFCKFCFELENSLSLYYQIIFRIVNDFVEGDLSNVNINCVIAFRNETFEIIRDASQELAGVHRIQISEQDVFSLYTIPREKIDTVFNLRRTYVEEGEAIDCSFSEYEEIAVHGLRHIMDTWVKSFTYIPMQHVWKRLYCNKEMFKIFFLTSGVKHYSQVNHGLTNIFLVNPNYRSDMGDITTEEAMEMDTPSLWLKYFLLAYICENTTDKAAILKLFSNKGTYSPDLVKIILLGFSEVEHGRIIKPNISRFNGRDAATIGIDLTSRGKKCIKSGLFFSFEYLACVVEDSYLRVPTSLLESFNNPKGIGFLTEANQENYNAELFDYLREKSFSVFTFILMLEEAYKVEKKQNKELFAFLENTQLKKYSPDFKKMREDAINTIDRMSNEFTDSQRKELKRIIVTALGTSRQVLIKRSIETIFNVRSDR